MDTVERIALHTLAQQVEQELLHRRVRRIVPDDAGLAEDAVVAVARQPIHTAQQEGRQALCAVACRKHHVAGVHFHAPGVSLFDEHLQGILRPGVKGRGLAGDVGRVNGPAVEVNVRIDRVHAERLQRIEEGGDVLTPAQRAQRLVIDPVRSRLGYPRAEQGQLHVVDGLLRRRFIVRRRRAAEGCDRQRRLVVEPADLPPVDLRHPGQTLGQTCLERALQLCGEGCGFVFSGLRAGAEHLTQLDVVPPDLARPRVGP